MLAEDRREWVLLCEALDAHPEGALHDPDSPAWTACDVYAHLARWVAHSTDDLESVLAGGGLTVIDEGSDDDTINARWQAADSSLTLAEARARAQAAFERRARAIESVPPGRWNAALEAIAHADDAAHYGAHRSWIRGT
jgi:hypothetical protein